MIRDAKIGDIPILLELWKELMREHEKIVIKENPELKAQLILRKDSKEIMRKFFQKNIRSRKAMVFVAEINGKLVGYCMVFIKKNSPVYKLKEFGYISDLFVKESFRGMKISSGFRDKALEWFRKKSVKHMTLDVFVNNKHAHEIYNKWGLFDYTINMRKMI